MIWKDWIRLSKDPEWKQSLVSYDSSMNLSFNFWIFFFSVHEPSNFTDHEHTIRSCLWNWLQIYHNWYIYPSVWPRNVLSFYSSGIHIYTNLLMISINDSHIQYQLNQYWPSKQYSKCVHHQHTSSTYCRVFYLLFPPQCCPELLVLKFSTC